MARCCGGLLLGRRCGLGLGNGLRPRGRLLRHRHSGLGVSSDLGFLFELRRRSFGHRLRPFRRRFLHRQRGGGSIAAAFVGDLGFAGHRGRVCPRRRRLLHRERRLGLSRLLATGVRRLGHGLDGRSGHGWRRGRHLRFGQIGQQRLHIVGCLRRVARFGGLGILIVHGDRSQSIFGAPSWRSGPATLGAGSRSSKKIRKGIFSRGIWLLLGPIGGVGSLPVALGLDPRRILRRDPAALDQP